ncbi:MAG: hypothetical protein ACRDZ1_00990 [Acidimicrobiia bacterium]
MGAWQWRSSVLALAVATTAACGGGDGDHEPSNADRVRAFEAEYEDYTGQALPRAQRTELVALARDNCRNSDDDVLALTYAGLLDKAGPSTAEAMRLGVKHFCLDRLDVLEDVRSGPSDSDGSRGAGSRESASVRRFASVVAEFKPGLEDALDAHQNCGAADCAFAQNTYDRLFAVVNPLTTMGAEVEKLGKPPREFALVRLVERTIESADDAQASWDNLNGCLDVQRS